MNESTHQQDQQDIHEGTVALQEIAADVERERAERGGSEFDEMDRVEQQQGGEESQP